MLIQKKVIDLVLQVHEKFNEYLKEEGVTVETGIFQTMMEVNIVNDGPVTIVYEKLTAGN